MQRLTFLTLCENRKKRIFKEFEKIFDFMAVQMKSHYKFKLKQP